MYFGLQKLYRTQAVWPVTARPGEAGCDVFSAQNRERIRRSLQGHLKRAALAPAEGVRGRHG